MDARPITPYNTREQGQGESKATEEDTKERYLKDSGVTTAIRDCLKSLFQEGSLPDNPFLFLANRLDAYVDQSSLWKKSDAEILSKYDLEGNVEVVSEEIRLCKYSAADAFGLPHVLRLVSRDAIKILSHVLIDTLPDNFMPSPMPYSTKDGYELQIMASLQGNAVLWRPDSLDFPEINVRYDIRVTGARIEEAVRIFVDQVLVDLEDVKAVPVYFVEGLSFVDPPSSIYEGRREPFLQYLPLSTVYEKPEEFDKDSLRLVLGNKCIQMRCVVLIDPSGDPAGASAAFSGASPPGAGAARPPTAAPQKLVFKLVVRTYYFHFCGLEQSRPGLEQVQHYGTLPYEAMFQGYFFNISAARQYLSLFSSDKPHTRDPYSKENIDANVSSLKRQVDRGLRQAASLDAYRTACGFCGIVGSCDSKLVAGSTKSTKAVASDCLFAHLKMRPKSAAKSTAGQPATNRLVERPHCVNAKATVTFFWSCCFLDHVQTRHPTLQPLELAALVNEFAISKEEFEAVVSKLSVRIKVMKRLGKAPINKFWSKVLLLIMLRDDVLMKPARLAQRNIRPLEEACTGQRTEVVRGKSRFAKLTESDYLLRVVPNLLRITNSMAANIDGIAKEMHASVAAARSWPLKLAALKAGTGGDGAPGTASTFSSRVRTGQSRMTLRTPEVSSATLKWLRTFDMHARLLEQLRDLKQRARGATGRGLFSGFSLMVQLISEAIPDEPPRAGSEALLARLQSTLFHLSALLNTISLTVAHGFLGRCMDVVWALRTLRIAGRQDKIDAAAMIEDGLFIPDWVLDVQSLEQSQVRSGALASRVASEGVMLQYAVDTHLDQLLGTVWLTITKPPMPLNPFPRLMNMIRSHAAKMELLREGMDDCLELLLNDVTLLQLPSWLYSARPSPNAMRALRKATTVGAGRVAPVDEESWVVYGSYCATALSDARALQALRGSLGDVLEPRTWHAGGYEGEVIPSLVGDASLSNAMRLDDFPAWSAAVRSGMLGSKRNILPAAFEHPRFYTVEGEEHHLVCGPRRKEAAEAFAREVVNGLHALHERASPAHVVHSLQLLWDPVAAGKKGAMRPRTPGRPATASTSGRPGTPSDGGGGRGGAAGSIGVAGISSHAGAGSATCLLSPGAPSGLPAFDMSDWGDPLRKEELVTTLVEAARAAPPGQRVASVLLYVASKEAENLYVPLRRHLLFTHAKAQPPLTLNSAMGPGAGPGGGATSSAADASAQRPSTAERELMFWDRAVYQRVFLTEASSQLWCSWHAAKGDPAQPFQYLHMVSEAGRAMQELSRAGRMVDMLKLMLLCSVAMQDDVGIYQLSRSCMSTAQELASLLDMNRALVHLMDHRAPAGSRKPVDNERLRHTFLVYCSRMRRALASPKYNYFAGLKQVAPKTLNELHEHVLSNFSLGSRQLAQMDNLNVWTQACEVSVSNALLDCFDEAVLASVMGRVAGAETAGRR
ncbi:hypothetical protein FOA52_002160 [Chlamydomonas sp. UWO 241]|nr:hypothetical protein FOA52_002160 [Chlamydomonas sp. UWO 241]